VDPITVMDASKLDVAWFDHQSIVFLVAETRSSESPFLSSRGTWPILDVLAFISSHGHAWVTVASQGLDAILTDISKLETLEHYPDISWTFGLAVPSESHSSWVTPSPIAIRPSQDFFRITFTVADVKTRPSKDPAIASYVEILNKLGLNKQLTRDAREHGIPRHQVQLHRLADHDPAA
jgi:hypothetical protein